jgi:hypothetical protein
MIGVLWQTSATCEESIAAVKLNATRYSRELHLLVNSLDSMFNAYAGRVLERLIRQQVGTRFCCKSHVLGVGLG